LTPQSLRILLIADDPELIRRIGQGLQKQDSGLILLEGADSLATARRRLGAGDYDLALLDLGLDQGDGLKLIADLREMAAELPIVAVSANGDTADITACLAAGAHDRLAPAALDSAGFVDRLRSATARAAAGRISHRHSQRIVGSLGATGDLAWHWERGEDDVWVAAADPKAWRLPAAESHEGLEGLRERLHPDDREKIARRIEELVTTSLPWQVEARLKVGGGAYRWCEIRGRSQVDARGRIERAMGVVSDSQRQQRVLREIDQGRKLLRAIFDSDRIPRAVINATGVVTDCNQAWLALTETGCYAGKEFGPGTLYPEESARAAPPGGLAPVELARGVRQVLGGVTELFSCDYGDGQRRWRMRVVPLLNPGIAGAIVTHEDITEANRPAAELQDRLAAAEADLGALGGAVLRIDSDFRLQAANTAAEGLGRTPVPGRDVLKSLPRLHADAVGAALAELSAGAESAVRDTRPANGQVTRWVVTLRRDAGGSAAGFLAHATDVSDLAEDRHERAPEKTAEAAQEAPSASDHQNEKLRSELAAARERLEEAEREQPALRHELQAERQRLAEARQALTRLEQERADLDELLTADRQRIAELQAGLEALEADREALREDLEQEQRRAELARHDEAAAQQRSSNIQAQFDDAQLRLEMALAAQAEAESVPEALRAELAQARHRFQAELGSLFDSVFKPVLNASRKTVRAPSADQGEEKAG
jgi:PAS domain-containing protein/ActR/RegA family two-component response regulator